jgi:hypothetical protein
MRVRALVAVTAAGMLCGFAAAAAEPGEPKADSVTVDDALAEPADPDDAVNIVADDDPSDVGQEALEPAAGTPPADPAGAGDGTDPD